MNEDYKKQKLTITKLLKKSRHFGGALHTNTLRLNNNPTLKTALPRVVENGTYGTAVEAGTVVEVLVSDRVQRERSHSGVESDYLPTRDAGNFVVELIDGCVNSEPSTDKHAQMTSTKIPSKSLSAVERGNRTAEVWRNINGVKSKNQEQGNRSDGNVSEGANEKTAEGLRAALQYSEQQLVE